LRIKKINKKEKEVEVMKVKCFIFCLVVILVSSTMVAAEAGVKSTAEEQAMIELTVYNNNLALVKDTRNVELPVGQGELNFIDVASHIMPVTVHTRSLNYPEHFTVLEQTYQYDLMSPDSLLDKYVGEKIKIINWNVFQDRQDIVEAILLSNNQGQIYKINDEIYLGYPGYKVLPGLPEDFVAEPTLRWFYENRAEKAHKLEVSYLTANINWKADYIVILRKDDTSSDISAWVSLDNKSGATYKNARLKLIAGKVHRVEEAPVGYLMKSLAEAEFEEKVFFEYHLYDLKRKTTIKDNETKQISLLKALDVAIQKEFLVYGTKTYFTRPRSEPIAKQPISVYIKFKNSEDNNLGVPLPAGIMRVYRDEDRSLQFIGEDRIPHTPKDEEIRLKVGEAFDVVAERVQTDYREVTSKLYESEWEITVKNHKEKDVTVGIVEPLLGNWQIIRSSHPYQKVDASTIRFNVNVPSNQEVKVSYRVRIGL
jgi:hypothetical protein